MPIFDSLMVALVGMIVVMAELALLAAIIIVMSKVIHAATEITAAAKTNSPEVFNSAPAAPGTIPETQSAGRLDLHNVADKTAAMLMAIVSNEAGIPLNELRFISIRALD